MSNIVSCRFEVSGVETDRHAKKALPSLYDIFAEHGIGQASFELRAGQNAELVVKHADTVHPDPAVIDGALARTGDFRVVSSTLRTAD